MSNIAESDNTIYLDYAATTPLDPEVLEKMLPYFGPEFGNPSSLYKSGRRARQAIERAREETAKIINANPEEIIFTGSGTESDNLAILGIARAYRSFGNHIIVSAIEHKAVLESAVRLSSEGFSVTFLPVDNLGRVDTKKLLEAITPETILVSIMYANNEIGTIEPIKEISKALMRRKESAPDSSTKKFSGIFPIFHTDACQAAGYLSLDVKELGVDLMTLNGSKIYGPKGVGMLYVKRGVTLLPVIIGGEQEKSLRAGTESVPLIVGFAEALKKANSQQKKESVRLSVLRDYFIKRLKEETPDLSVNGDLQNRLPNNVHVSVPNVEGESILLMLDINKIEASTGSACSARDLKPSHVLLALGQSADLAHGSIRFTLGKYTSKKDIDYVLSVFPDIIKRLKSISALTVKNVENMQ
jgi:cysteine desulfurase